MIARFTRGSARSALAISLATLPIAVPSMAYAQEGATAAGGVGDIVVTAMRREQRIQDVPVSISAFGGESIEKRQAVQISDLIALSPNSQVNYPFGEGGPPNFVIRGISSTDYSANQSKPIAIYIDEGIRGLSTFETMPLYDVERVEVLRGPQGTLYGKNATGGAVNIVTKKPGFSTEGYVTGSYGNFNRVRLQGALQVPLIDDVLAVRLAALYVHDTGVLKNVTPGLGDLDQTDVFAFRGALQFEPADNFEATLRFNHVKSGGRNYTAYAGNIDFNDPQIIFPGNNLSNLPGSNRDGLSFFESAVNRAPKRLIRSDGFNLIMNWEATDTLKLTSVTTYDWGKWVDTGDDDGLAIQVDDPIVTFGKNMKQFVQDLRLATSFDGPFNVQAGLLYTYDTVNAGFSYSLLTDPGCGAVCTFGFTPTGTGFIQSNDFDQKRKSYAAYLRGDFEITDTLSVYGGVRFSRDKVAVSNFNAFLGDNVDAAALQTISDFSDRRTFNNTSFEVGANWKPTQDVLLYASMREGYACLVAIMSMGHGYHRESQARLHQVTVDNGNSAPVVSSAGALVDGIKAIGAKKVAIVAPYMKPLTEMVVNYIRSEGVEVAEWRALEISDNLAVAAHDPARLPGIVASMEQIGDVDAVVLSACVQMPSLPAVSIVEAQVGKPVLTAAIATTWAMLKSLDLDTRVPGGGTLLSGAY